MRRYSFFILLLSLVASVSAIGYTNENLPQITKPTLTSSGTGDNSSFNQTLANSLYLQLSGSNQINWTPTSALVLNLNASWLRGYGTGGSGKNLSALDKSNTYSLVQNFNGGALIQGTNRLNFVADGTANYVPILYDDGTNFHISTYNPSGLKQKSPDIYIDPQNSGAGGAISNNGATVHFTGSNGAGVSYVNGLVSVDGGSSPFLIQSAVSDPASFYVQGDTELDGSIFFGGVSDGMLKLSGQQVVTGVGDVDFQQPISVTSPLIFSADVLSINNSLLQWAYNQTSAAITDINNRFWNKTQTYNKTEIDNNLSLYYPNSNPNNYVSNTTVKRLTSATTNSTTSTSWTQLFAFNVNANQNYTLNCLLLASSNLTTTGVQLNVSLTQTPTLFGVGIMHPLTVTTGGNFACSGVLTQCIDSSTSGVVYPTMVPVTIVGDLINAGNAGVINVSMKSEVTDSLAVIQGGSYCELNQE